jgi:transposase
MYDEELHMPISNFDFDIGLDNLFLKSNKRIMALIMIMTLSLLVYSLLERRIRQLLKEKKLTIANQLGKPTDNPTLRWICQIFNMLNVAILRMDDGSIVYKIKLNSDQRTILEALGPLYEKYYFCHF